MEIKLKENDAPTDHAWLVTLPAAGKPPRRRRRASTARAARRWRSWAGSSAASGWASSTPIPTSDRDYELSVILRRKPPPIPKETKPAAPERFFGKKR